MRSAERAITVLESVSARLGHPPAGRDRLPTGGEMDSPKDGASAAGRLDTAGSAQPASIWPKVATDYHGALVRLATMRAAGKQYLLFGYVELFPRDIPV